MGLSQRNRRKHITKAMTMLPAGTNPLDYAVGGGGSAPPRLLGLATIGGAAALSVLASMLLHSVTIIGALPMLAVYFAINKPRGVLLSDRGLALFTCGFLNGRPNQLLGTTDLTPLAGGSSPRAGSLHLSMGEHPVWLPERDVARFRSATRPVPPPVA